LPSLSDLVRGVKDFVDRVLFPILGFCLKPVLAMLLLWVLLSLAGVVTLLVIYYLLSMVLFVWQPFELYFMAWRALVAVFMIPSLYYGANVAVHGSFDPEAWRK